MPWSSLIRLVPGLLLVVLIAAGAVWIGTFTGPFGVAPVALGVLAGLIVGNLVPLDARWDPGISFGGKQLLTVAVVLLGLRLSFEQVARIGVPLAVATGVVAGAVVVAFVLGRWWRVSPSLAVMIGAGTGVCGVAAVAAVRPAVSGRKQETAYAVGAVALLGSLGLVVFPVVQWVWHPLDPSGFGALAGASLHSVPQAIGAGFAGGGEPGGLFATLVKLTRVALLAPLVLGIIVVARMVGGPSEDKRLPRVPVEVWGFLLMAGLVNLVPVPEWVVDGALAVSGGFLVVSLTALGLATRFRELQRSGWRPLALAVVVWLLVVAVVFLVLRAHGPLGL